MDFVNETKLAAGWTMGFDPDGRELIVVVAKATFRFPPSGGSLELAPEQVPLIEADEFTGEPGRSAVLYETDYAHRKPRCDILLNGSAHAPDGRPTTEVRVGLQVAQMHKAFTVVGDRFWDAGLLGSRPSEPRPFVSMPISYDCAFGGTDIETDDPKRVATYASNPVGRGYYPLGPGERLLGRPLPNTCEDGRPVMSRDGPYKPMAFGALGRNFSTRHPLAGTYDQDWSDHRVPYWPVDFDYAYFQAAPLEQQIPYPRGWEQVALINLTPEGRSTFRLPDMRVSATLIRHKGEDQLCEAVLDTILIEPDDCRLMLTWRAAESMSRSCFDLKRIRVRCAFSQSTDPGAGSSPTIPNASGPGRGGVTSPSASAGSRRS